MTEEEFLEHIRPQLEQAGIYCNFTEDPWVYCEDGTKCSGYFDGNEKILAVAKGKPNWFGILVHEYCHFEQWREDCAAWSQVYVEGKREALEVLMDAFYEGRDLDDETIARYCHKSATVELDCEKRVLKKIADLNLPMDAKEYAKAANSYVVFYYTMPVYRKWCDKVPPYMVPDILDAMPDHMDVDHQALAKQHLELFRQCVE